MRGRGDRGRDPRRREEGLEEGDAGHVQEDLAAGPHQYGQSADRAERGQLL